MHKLSKKKVNQRIQYEKLLVAALRDKLNAHANAQLKEDALTKKYNHKNLNECKQNHPRKTSRKSLSQIETEINLLLKANGLVEHITNAETPELTREEKWMIHLD